MRATNKKTTPRGRKKSCRKKGHASYLRRTWGVWLSVLLAVALFAFVCYHIMNRNLMGGSDEPPLIDGYEVRGIDVSHHQGRIDWPRVAKSKICGVPVSFVFIKATEGTDLVDPYFHRNISRARKAGLAPGAYHFFSPVTSPDAQAELFIRNVALEYGDLPPVLDVEQAPHNISKQEFQKRVHRWLHLVEAEMGVKPIIYTGVSFKKEYLNDITFNAYPLWLAHYYVEQVNYAGEWSVWQYTDRGQLDGIRGRVDFNIFNGSLGEFELLRYDKEQ